MRTLRVYDGKGDFTIEIPDEARVTFGYFNPVTGAVSSKHSDWNGPGAQTAKTSALRIYTKDGKTETQLACFMGINGFRDLSLKLVKINNRVVVEQNFEDDGDGKISFGSTRKQELVMVTEPGSYQ